MGPVEVAGTPVVGDWAVVEGTAELLEVGMAASAVVSAAADVVCDGWGLVASSPPPQPAARSTTHTNSQPLRHNMVIILSARQARAGASTRCLEGDAPRKRLVDALGVESAVGDRLLQPVEEIDRAAQVRDHDRSAHHQPHRERLEHLLAGDAGILALGHVVADAVIAAQHHRGGQPPGDPTPVAHRGAAGGKPPGRARRGALGPLDYEEAGPAQVPKYRRGKTVPSVPGLGKRRAPQDFIDPADPTWDGALPYTLVYGGDGRSATRLPGLQTEASFAEAIRKATGAK